MKRIFNLILFITFTIFLFTNFAYYKGNDKKESSSNGGNEDLQGRLQYEFNMLKDPATNKIPKNIRYRELQYAKTLPKIGNLNFQTNSSKYSASNPLEKTRMQNKLRTLQSLSWNQLGPDNQGGRTRALTIDVSNENIILAGGVSGGMWRSVDGGQTWTKTTKPGQLQSVSCIAQDTRTGHDNVFYYGTGENDGNSASAPGASFSGNGIYKSTDSGADWQLLPSTQMTGGISSTSAFQFVWNIAVDPSTDTSDIVYAAVYGGIERSTDGGKTWENVLGYLDSGKFTDVLVTKNGTVYATISSDGFDSGIFKSTSGTKGSFKEITPTGFPTVFRRIVMDAAPSDQNQVYFLAETPDAGKVFTLKNSTKDGYSLWKYTNGTSPTWENRSAHIPAFGGKTGNFNSQGSYDLMIKVKPDDPNFVIIGGTNLFRSKDGFSTDISNPGDWIGGYTSSNNSYAPYPNHHPDQHALVYLPSNPKVVYCADDGGIQKSEDVTSSNVSWTKSDKGYITSQFYSVAMDESANGDNILIGGLQDNANLFSNSNSLADWNVIVAGGDGGITAISNNKSYYYIETQNGDVSRANITNTNNWEWTEIKPKNASNFLFVTPFVLNPSNTNMMFLAAGGYIWRNNDLNSMPSGNRTSTSVNWTKMTNTHTNDYISAIGVSKSPANVLYYGTSKGKVFRVDDANSGDPTPKNIWSYSSGNSKLSAGAYVSCIAVDPDSANHVMVVFSNYNVQSLYYSSDGGNNWYTEGGNLEQDAYTGAGDGPSCRWATILNEHGSTFYFVATSTGLYSTTRLNYNNTVWAQEGPNSIGNMVCSMVKSRETDGKLIVATHGAGVYSSNLSTGTMSGTYTINYNGSGSRNFKSFAGAIKALESYYVSGPVIFNVENDSYIENITIPAIPGVNSTNTITFQAASGFNFNDKVILNKYSGSNDNWVIKLDGASYINFRNITIEALDNQYAKAIVLTNHASHDTFYHDIIEGDSVNSSSDNYALVYSGSNPLNNIDFELCTFHNGSHAIEFKSTNSYVYSDSLRIINNKFNYVSDNVIDIANAKRAAISENTIIGGKKGIKLSLSDSLYDPYDNEIGIRRNKIREVSYTGIQAFQCKHLLISNNFVRSESEGLDLRIDTSMVYYNSVDVSGKNSSGYGLMSAIHLTSFNKGGNKIENNIFANDLGGYAYATEDPKSPAVSDYNDLYSNGRYLIYFNNQKYVNLKNFLTGHFTEFHSVYAKPLFTSEDDMTPQSDWMSGKADPSINNIVDHDIFQYARSNSIPDIGAAEYLPDQNGDPLSNSSYTIGAGGDYATFNDALTDLIKRGISHSITFNVKSGNYKEQLYFTVIPGLSAKDTIVFKPVKEYQVNINYDTTYVAAFNNVNHITFYGLAFQNMGNDVGSSFKYHLYDILIGQNMNNCTFNGCSFIEPKIGPNVGYVENYSNIYSSNAFADSNTIKNCQFTYGGFGININRGGSYGTSGLKIISNSFNDQTSTAIRISYENLPAITSNSVDSTQDGIVLRGCKNININRNLVYNASKQGIYLNACQGNSKTLSLIANNFIEGTNWGISVGSSDTLHFYDNSINIEGKPSYGTTAAIRFDGSNYNELRNNIFADKSGGYALFTLGKSAITTSDYNDFYTNGRVLVSWAGSNYFDIKSYINAQKKDAHSLHAKPLYKSSTDPIPLSGWINNKGDASINNILPKDITLTVRSNTPDMGAIEYDPGANSSPLSKTVYTIGQSGDYQTLDDAAYDLTTRGVANADTFKIKSGTYNESVYFTVIPGTSNENTVTFQSESGRDSDVVISDTTSYVMAMDNIHNVTFKNLKIFNSSKFDYNKTQRVIALGNNVDNDTFSDCIIEGVKTGYNQPQYSLVLGQYIENHGDVFSGNQFINGTFGFFIYTSFSHSTISDLQIINNQFLSQSTGGDAIKLSQVDSPHIIGNSIDTANYAVNLNYCIGDIQVLRNKIKHVSNGINLNACKGTSKPLGLIANNFIQCTGTGIHLGSDTLHVFYNSVNIEGSPNNNNSDCFSLSGSKNVVKNNIFINKETGYGLIAEKMNSISDYNDYYTNGSKLIYYFQTGKDYSDISSYSSVVNQEQHSTSTNVTFKSMTNLHLSGNSVSDASLSGVPVSMVTTDIDGEMRSNKSPFMGADEAGVSSGGIIFVNKSAHGADDGTSWKNAYVNLQDALAAADRSSVIWTAKGTYKPDEGNNITKGKRDTSFVLKKSIELYGGFAGTESHFNERDWKKNPTILSGDIGKNDDSTDNSFHVVYAKDLDSTSVLDGFIISDGYADGKRFSQQNGGGIYDSTGGPVLKNLIIKNNYAKYEGGGSYNFRNKLSKVINVQFTNNTAQYGGGTENEGSNYLMNNVVFKSNNAVSESYGGGVYNDTSNLILQKVLLVENSATTGGGIYNSNSSYKIDSAAFVGDSAKFGGGIYNSQSDIILKNVLFSRNKATNGGGINNYKSNPSLTNVEFDTNEVSFRGGGIYNQMSNAMLEKVKFQDNYADQGGGMFSWDGKPQLDSVWFAGDSVSEDGGGMYNDSSNVVVSNSRFEANKANNGAGMFNYASNPSLNNIIFQSNIAYASGGAINNSANSSGKFINIKYIGTNGAAFGGAMQNQKSNPLIVNNLFYSDTASFGAALYNSESHPHIINSTFSNNLASKKGGGIFNETKSSPIIVNSIFWGDTAMINGDELFNQIGGSQTNFPVFTHSLVEGSGGSGATWNKDFGIDSSFNLDADPLFVDSKGGDFRLSPGSPALNAGINDSLPSFVKTDLEGNKRIIGSSVDMGAYEYQIPVFVKNVKKIPKTFALYQNYPNPFNPITQIKFDLPKAVNVQLIIYNILGQKVMTLVSGFMKAGSYTKTFNGDVLASGIYIYRLSAKDFVKVRKMILLK